MDIIYCDLCGRSLEKGDSRFGAGSSLVALINVRIVISEYEADSCDECSKKLIAYVKSGPWKTGSRHA